jgi:hypothetical protein
VADILLDQTNDGGEVTVENGVLALSEDGLAVSAYLSLFGGNDDDSGLQGDDKREWWGNKSERDPARQYRSATQNLLRALPLNTANLQRIEDAASRDLAWFTQEIASSVEVLATMPALNTVRLDVFVVVEDRRFQFTFVAKNATAA